MPARNLTYRPTAVCSLFSVHRSQLTGRMGQDIVVSKPKQDSLIAADDLQRHRAIVYS